MSSDQHDSEAEVEDGVKKDSVQWSNERFACLLPHIFNVAGNISFPYRLVCWNWYHSIWKSLYTKPLKIHIRHFPDNPTWTISLEQTQKQLGSLFCQHMANLEILVLDNYYVCDEDLAKFILKNEQSKLTTISLRMLQNHSEITLKGMERIASCSNLRSLALTTIGGTHNFQPFTFTPEMMALLADTLPTLQNLELSLLDVASFPSLAKMTKLTNLTLHFQLTLFPQKKPPPPCDSPPLIEQLALAFSKTLKHLTLYRPFGDWTGLTKGFDQLESLTLGYCSNTDFKLVSPWTGSCLQKLVIRSSPFLPFQPFFNCSNLKHLEVTKPLTWTNVSQFLSHVGASLTSLKIDSNLAAAESKELATLCPGIEELHISH